MEPKHPRAGVRMRREKHTCAVAREAGAVSRPQVHAEELATQRHYTPDQLGKLWGVSTNTIRRLFEDVLGVLVIDRPEEMHKRKYVTMRIPATVAAHVHSQYAIR